MSKSMDSLILDFVEREPNSHSRLQPPLEKFLQ